MKKLGNIGLAALAGALVVGAAVGRRGLQKQDLAPLPQDPALAPLELVDARAFVLDEPFTHTWRMEQPEVRAGYLLVLHADADLVRPRQTYEPVLYVGEETAERCNAGTDSGNLVCVVPSGLNPDGTVALDPTRAPIWFGTPALPETIDATAIRVELAAAVAKGVGPVSVTGAIPIRSTSSTLYARDRNELDLAIADLIELHSPTEASLVESLRVPLTR